MLDSGGKLLKWAVGMEPDGLKRVCEYPGRETAGPSTAIPRFLRPGEAHCRSLGYARDDKARTVTDL